MKTLPKETLRQIHEVAARINTVPRVRTLHEVATLLGITPQAVHAIEQRAIRKIAMYVVLHKKSSQKEL